MISLEKYVAIEEILHRLRSPRKATRLRTAIAELVKGRAARRDPTSRKVGKPAP